MNDTTTHVPTIIFEDDALLVLGKPAGWITNEATTTNGQPVVQTWIAKSLSFPIAQETEFRSGIVHRLDKETSGILLVAKTQDAFTGLQRQFKERTIKKTYMALVHGEIDGEGVVEVPVGRLPWRRDRFGVLPGGRDSKTVYKVTGYYKRGNELFSLVNLNPETGRTHQIRIHMKHINHPLVADEFYAGRKTARNDRTWCPRLFLHAGGITLNHPATGKSVSFEAPLPEDLATALASCTLYNK